MEELALEACAPMRPELLRPVQPARLRGVQVGWSSLQDRAQAGEHHEGILRRQLALQQLVQRDRPQFAQPSHPVQVIRIWGCPQQAPDFLQGEPRQNVFSGVPGNAGVPSRHSC